MLSAQLTFTPAAEGVMVSIERSNTPALQFNIAMSGGQRVNIGE